MVRVDFPGVNMVSKRLADGSRRVYYYHRASGVRLPDDPRSLEFAAAYAKLNTIPAKRAEGPGAGTIAKLIQEFKASPDFRQLSDQTRSAYARHMETIERGRKGEEGAGLGCAGGCQDRAQARPGPPRPICRHAPHGQLHRPGATPPDDLRH